MLGRPYVSLTFCQVKVLTLSLFSSNTTSEECNFQTCLRRFTRDKHAFLTLACQHWTRVERHASDKHSSLLQTLVNYDHENFYNICIRGQCYRTFYDRKLQIFLISQSVCPKLFEPSLMFVGKAGAYQNEAPFMCSTLRQALDLPPNIRVAWKGQTVANTLVYCGNS